MRLDTDEAFRRYADRVYASAFSITRDPTDADDATQDTFLRYHTRSDDFESEAHLKAWLLRVAINECKKCLLDRNRRVPLSEIKGEALSYSDDQRDITWALMRVEPKYREVL